MEVRQPQGKQTMYLISVAFREAIAYMCTHCPEKSGGTAQRFSMLGHGGPSCLDPEPGAEKASEEWLPTPTD